jgi:hypothetical protein
MASGVLFCLLAELVVRMVETKEHLAGSLDVVGPAPMTTDGPTTALRRWLGLPSRSIPPVPEALAFQGSSAAWA